MTLALSASLTLAIDGVVGLAIAVLYAYVGRMMARRTARADADRRALRAFALWWRALALLMAVGALRSILAATGVTSLSVHAPLAFLGLAPLAAALGGLVYDLLYIWTGRESLFRPTALAHGAMFVFFVGLVAWLAPAGVSAEPWRATIRYERPLEGPLAFLALGLLLGPALFAAAAYGSLLLRARDRTVRYRIALVSGAFLLWFGSAAVGAAAGIGDWTWWPLVSRAVALLATGMVLAAYRPPRWAQTRWGLGRLEETDAPGLTLPAGGRPQARAVEPPAGAAA